MRYVWSAVVGCAMAAAPLVLASHAEAAVVFTASGAALSPNETFDWDVVAFGSVPSPTHFDTGANGFTVSDPQNNLSVGIFPGFFLSNGGTDAMLEAPINTPQSGPIRIVFDQPVLGVGANMEWGGFEVGTYTLRVFASDNTLLGATSINSGTQGDPAFLGFRDSIAEIAAAEFEFNGPTAPHSIGLGDLSLVNVTAVPEPATFGLLVVGLAGLAFGRRQDQARCVAPSSLV